MSEKEYLDADCEVIGMVNKGRGDGGELPGKSLTFIPSARAERVEALDLRIQQLQKMTPIAGKGAAALLFIFAAALGWVKPLFAALAVGVCLLWAAATHRKEEANA